VPLAVHRLSAGGAFASSVRAAAYQLQVPTASRLVQRELEKSLLVMAAAVQMQADPSLQQTTAKKLAY